MARKREVEIDYYFLVRCILGAIYQENELKYEHYYKNCIIKLLNSSIDVDKLDYITRDSQVSGYENTTVDTNRLLSSLVLAQYKDTDNNYKLCLAFRKTALGIIQNVVLSRNSLYTWIYSHHKVVYETHLIQKAIEKIAKKQGKNSEVYLSKLFSIDSIKNQLVCDDTIWNIFMQNLDVPEVMELIDRSSRKVALWKSFAEFEAYFNNKDMTIPIGEFSCRAMREYFSENKNAENNDWEEFRKHLKKFKHNNSEMQIDFTVVCNKIKLSNIEHHSIFVYLNDRLYDFNELFRDLYQESAIPPFIYLYCSKEDKEKFSQNSVEGGKLKNKLIEHIKSFDKFKQQPNVKRENR